MNGASDELSENAASNEEDLISEMLSQQQIDDLSNNENDVSACANCGKEGINLNICNKCKEATYCNAACKKKHRSKHKKQCEKRVSELHDGALFKEPPPEFGDCPICFLLLPTMNTGRRYMECCGKMICSGCGHAPVFDNHGNIIVGKNCPFCRTSSPTTNKEIIERMKKHMELGDAYAFFMMGNFHDRGDYGVPQDSAKAIEYWHKAGNFGYNNTGSAYYNGNGVERDKKMATHYYELSAMGGNVTARNNLGINERKAGNFDRHFMIAVKGGHTESVKDIQEMYMNGHAIKDHYANALQSHQAYLVEIKSGQRDKAAALGDGYRYY